MEKKIKGINGNLILTDKGITITRGVKGFLLGGGNIRGDKNIPYSSIVAVQFKKAGRTNGYIQFSIKGGSEAKGGLIQAVSDENTITFSNWSNKDFLEAKELIESNIYTGDNNLNKSSFGDLEELAKLKDKGIITEEEFNAKKKEILGL